MRRSTGGIVAMAGRGKLFKKDRKKREPKFQEVLNFYFLLSKSLVFKLVSVMSLHLLTLCFPPCTSAVLPFFCQKKKEE